MDIRHWMNKLTIGAASGDPPPLPRPNHRQEHLSWHLLPLWEAVLHGALPIERPAASFNCCATLDHAEHAKSQQTPPRGPSGAMARSICSAQTMLTSFYFSPIGRPAVSFKCQPGCARFPCTCGNTVATSLLTWRGGNAEKQSLCSSSVRLQRALRAAIRLRLEPWNSFNP